MKKLLLLAVSMLLTSSLFAQGIYLRGAINSWEASADYEFTTSDQITYTLEKSFTLTGSFKIADKTWSSFNYGSNGATVNVGVELALVSGSQTNFDCGSNAFQVTKIELDLLNETMVITGTAGKDEFDVTKDYGLFFGQYFNNPTETVREAMTFKGNGEYTLTTTLKTQELGCKIADLGYVVDFGSNGENVYPSTPYAAKKGGANMWFDEETIVFGNEYTVTITIDKDYNAACLFVPAPTAAEEAAADAPSVVAIYNMIGQPVTADAAGLKIFVYSNGTTEKKY